MKNYQVDVDVTMSTTICVSADSEQQAEAVASQTVRNSPNYHASRGSYVEHTVISTRSE